jgi:hypothetical protein
MKINDKYLIKFDELQVGQTLWSAMYGDVTIIELNERRAYPIIVKDRDESITGFTKDGKNIELHDLPTLFLSCPYGDSFQSREMDVSDDKVNWTKKTVIAEHCGWFITYDDKSTILVGNYLYAREITTTELTMEQIADKFNIPVEQLKIKK